MVVRTFLLVVAASVALAPSARASDAYPVAIGRRAMFALLEEGVPPGRGEIVDRRWDAEQGWQLEARAVATADAGEEGPAIVVIGGAVPCVGTLGAERVVTLTRWSRFQPPRRSFRARAIEGCPPPRGLAERIAITGAARVRAAVIDRARRRGLGRTTFRVRGEAELSAELEMRGPRDGVCAYGPTIVRARWPGGAVREVTVSDPASARVLFGAWVDGELWLALSWSDAHVRLVALGEPPHEVLDVEWPQVIDLGCECC